MFLSTSERTKLLDIIKSGSLKYSYLHKFVIDIMQFVLIFIFSSLFDYIANIYKQEIKNSNRQYLLIYQKKNTGTLYWYIICISFQMYADSIYINLKNINCRFC